VIVGVIELLIVILVAVVAIVIVAVVVVIVAVVVAVAIAIKQIPNATQKPSPKRALRPPIINPLKKEP
jgi:hypothetical protein